MFWAKVYAHDLDCTRVSFPKHQTLPPVWHHCLTVLDADKSTCVVKQPKKPLSWNHRAKSIETSPE